jgi:hypothetical protein
MAKTKTPIIQLVVMKMISGILVGFLFFPVNRQTQLLGV